MDQFHTPERSWTAADVAQLLTGRSALGDLDAAMAERVVRRMQGVRFPRGTIIFQEGARNSDTMLLLLSGEVSVECRGLAGSDALMLGHKGPGHVIGEVGLIDGATRSASCIATSDVACAVLTRDALRALADEEPLVAFRLLAVLHAVTAGHMRHMMNRLRHLKATLPPDLTPRPEQVQVTRDAPAGPLPPAVGFIRLD